MNKCPKCEKNIANLSQDEVTINATFTTLSKKVTVITCPHCHAVLSVIGDPYDFGGDTKEDIAKEVQKQVKTELANLQIVLSQILNEHLRRLGR
jgi:ssDNA-binding Zn-finger/Zn-ribbon topoisomerase 1